MNNYIFIGLNLTGLNRGRLYLNQKTMTVYRFPFFVLSFSAWPNLVFLFSSVLIFLIPVFNVSHNIRWLLSIITAVSFLVGMWGAHRMISEHYAAVVLTEEVVKISYDIRKVFRKQVVKSIIYTAIVVAFFGAIAAFGVWLVYCEGDSEYAILLGIYAALPMTVAYWACMRPIKTLVYYVKYLRTIK